MESIELDVLEKLSRIELTASEKEAVKNHLQQMVHYLQPLCNLDLSAVQPLLQFDWGASPTRPDLPQPSLNHEEAFRNAPQVDADHFVVPQVIS